MLFVPKRALLAIYSVAIVLVCVSMGACGVVAAWRSRTLGDRLFFGLAAAFMMSCAVMLVSQAITNRRYGIAAHALNLTVFDWNSSPAAETLRQLEIVRRGKVFVSDGLTGWVNGMNLYVFNYAFDVAWWSKKRTIAVIRRSNLTSAPDRAVQLMYENAGAELTVTPNWFVVHGRRRKSPNEL